MFTQAMDCSTAQCVPVVRNKAAASNTLPQRLNIFVTLNRICQIASKRIPPKKFAFFHPVLAAGGGGLRNSFFPEKPSLHRRPSVGLAEIRVAVTERQRRSTRRQRLVCQATPAGPKATWPRPERRGNAPPKSAGEIIRTVGPITVCQSTPAFRPAANQTAESNPRRPDECSRTMPAGRWIFGPPCRECKCNVRVNPH